MRSRKVLRLLLGVGALHFAGVGAESATAIPIANPGFEEPAHLDGGFAFGAPGWIGFGGVGFGAGTFNPTTSQYQDEAPEGSNVGWVVTYNSAGLSQTLAATYQAGNTYRLSVLVGDRDDHTGARYEIALLAGGIGVSSTGIQPIPAEGDFSLVSTSLDADASHDGQAIVIALYAWPGTELDPDQPPGASGSIADFDDVRLESSPTVAPGAGRVSQLLLGKTPAGEMSLAWQASCSTAADDYAVFSGALGSFTSHSRDVCSTAGMTTAVVPVPGDDRYYLIVPLDGTDEGSYGTDGNGDERIAGIVTCGTQNIGSACP